MKLPPLKIQAEDDQKLRMPTQCLTLCCMESLQAAFRCRFAELAPSLHISRPLSLIVLTCCHHLEQTKLL